MIKPLSYLFDDGFYISVIVKLTVYYVKFKNRYHII